MYYGSTEYPQHGEGCGVWIGVCSGRAIRRYFSFSHRKPPWGTDTPTNIWYVCTYSLLTQCVKFEPIRPISGWDMLSVSHWWSLQGKLSEANFPQTAWRRLVLLGVAINYCTTCRLQVEIIQFRLDSLLAISQLQCPVLCMQCNNISL